MDYIEIKGYKSIKNAKVELRPINILIGANGSGKSLTFMKRIIIICEGQTEREFCQKILYPFFLEKDIWLCFTMYDGGIS